MSTQVQQSDELLLAAYKVTEGAEDGLRRIESLLRLGQPSVADLCYTIRSRIKNPEKIAEKVSIKKEKNPKYEVNTIRDVIGVRLVTLQRGDALKIIPVLCKIIEDNSGSPPKAFSSKKLEEIKIYSTNPKGDPQLFPEMVKARFECLGHENVQIETTPQNYSSIHIVTWVNAKRGSQYVQKPVEFQIRTAFEDGWAEIEHSIRYKPNAIENPIFGGALVKATRSHLNIMKTFVDGVAQYAEQIRIQEERVFQPYANPYTAIAVHDTGAKVDAAQGLKNSVEVKLKTAFEQMRSVRESLTRYDELSHESAARKLESIKIMIERALSEQEPVADANTALLIEYYLPMEIAFCNLNIGSLISSREATQEDARIYEAISEKFEKKSLVRYRIGDCFEQLSKNEFAAFNYKKSVRINW